MEFYRIACCLVMLLIAGPLQARMYQWVSPNSGYTQFSGKPPAWYRSKAAGPRVLVFERGRLIDDTDIEVPDAQREALRTQAFQLLEQLKPSAAPVGAKLNDRAESSHIRTESGMPDRTAPLEREDKAAAELKASETQERVPKQEAKGMDTTQTAAKQAEDQFIEGLKRIIADWDRRKEEEAKRLLETKGNTEEQTVEQPPSLGQP